MTQKFTFSLLSVLLTLAASITAQAPTAPKSVQLDKVQGIPARKYVKVVQIPGRSELGGASFAGTRAQRNWFFFSSGGMGRVRARYNAFAGRYRPVFRGVNYGGAFNGAFFGGARFNRGPWGYQPVYRVWR